MSTSDPSLTSLLSIPQNADERALAARYTPRLLFDTREPFLPLAAGYTIFHHDAPSPSFPRSIELTPPGQPPAALAIEYAIWWDWDIEHLYELEYAWVFVDDQGQVVRGEASWHGGYHDMAQNGHLHLAGDHMVIYSEPGKHDFAPTIAWFQKRRQQQKRPQSSVHAGQGGVWVTPLFEGKIKRTPWDNTLVHTYLERLAFDPSWDYSRQYAFSPTDLVPWPALEAWIPGRVAWWVKNLKQEIRPQSYRFLRIGHRGAPAYMPENTLASFRKAGELGADMVEIDVRMTADGQTVVSHEPYLNNGQESYRLLNKSTLAQLKAIDLGGGERIPTLEETLACCEEEGLMLYIEIKEGSTIPSVVATVSKYRAEP